MWGGEGGINQTVYPNTNIMATSKNMTAKYKDMDTDNLSILKNAPVKEYKYDPAPQVDGLSFLSNFLVNANFDNQFLPLLHPDAFPDEDKIPVAEVVYGREVEYNTDEN